MKKWKVVLSCMLLSIGVFAFSGVTASAEDAPAADSGEGSAAFATLGLAPEPQPAAEPGPVAQELAAATEVPQSAPVAEPALETLVSGELPKPEAPVAVEAPQAASPETAAVSGGGEELAAEGDNSLFQDGEHNVNGQWYYYENGEAVTGWKALPDGRLVYYNPGGEMQLGERRMDDDKWYYFSPENGAWQGGWQNFDGRQLYYDWENGMYRGEGQVEGAWRYFNESNGNLVTGQVSLDDGRNVCYDENGMVYGEVFDGVNWRYFDIERSGDMATGFRQMGDGRLVYYNEDGGMHWGERRMDDGKWYFFRPGDGAWQGSYVELPDGRTVYYDWENGMYTDQEGQDTQGRWWYFNGDGTRASGITQLPDGRLVCYSADYGMLFGEQSIDGKWWHFNDGTIISHSQAGIPGAGGLCLGWMELADGRFVYYDWENGMLTGEHNLGGSWWYFDPLNGDQAVGHTTLPDGRNVFYDDYWGMLFGWWNIDDVNHHFDEESGNLISTGEDAPDPFTPDRYLVSSNGRPPIANNLKYTIALMVQYDLGDLDGRVNTNQPGQMIEVYKAYAVVLYSFFYEYALYGNGVPSVYTAPSAVGAALTATNAVYGQYLAYRDYPISVWVTGSTAGRTNSFENYWGGEAIPYLSSVDDAEGITNADRITVVTESEMAEAVGNMIGRPASGDPASWFIPKGVGSYLSGASVMNQDVTAAWLFNHLEQLPSLYVSDFTYNAQNRTWTFHTTGEGEGVGLSMEGATSMAEQGKTYSEILAHYFPGTTLERY